LYIDAERDQNAGMSSALPAYTFDNIGQSSATLDTAMSAAENSGRYIQDDLAVVMPDGTSLPLASLAADSSVFTLPGMVDGRVLATEVGQYFNVGVDHNQAQPTPAAAVAPVNSVINNDLSIPGGSDSLNLGANMSEAITSEELTQYLQNNPVLTEMHSEEFHRQFDGIVFQQVNDGAARPPQFSEH